MAIHVSCPQCQTSFTLPDTARGKQVRCKECFQVFHAGGEPSDAPSDPPPAPAPTPKPAVKPTSKLAAKPAPARPATVKPAAKPALAQKKAAPAARRPQPVNALDFSAADEHPTTSHHRRRRGWGGVIAVLVLLFLLVVGGGAAVVGVLAYLGKLPPQLAALVPIHAPQAAAKPEDAATPDKDGAPTPPKPDKPDQPKPDKPKPPAPADEPKPDKPKPPAPDLPAKGTSDYITKETFEKIGKGMTLDDLKALFGPPARMDPDPRNGTVAWSGKVGMIMVALVDGKATAKFSTQSWSNTFPDDVAKNPPPDNNPPPPPDRPAGVPSQENYNKIAMGMSLEDVRKLLGMESRKLPTPGGQEIYEWGNGGQSIAVGIISNGHGVYTKSTGWDWPLVWPGDAAVTPTTPDKPAGQMNRATFDKIAKGMSLDDLVALVGKPTNTDKIDPAFNARVDTHLSWLVFGANTGVDLFQGKVVNKVNFQNWPLVWPGDVAVNPPPPPDKNPPAPPPPDKHAWAVTEENFDKVDKEMTREAVIALLGAANETLNLSSDGERVRLSWYGPKNMTIQVEFFQGKASGKFNPNMRWPVFYPSDAVKTPPPDNSAAAVTKENFDKIAKGMTKDEVVKLLGPAGEESSVMDPKGVKVAFLKWKDGDKRLEVVLNDDKVMDKSNEQNWPVVYPGDAAQNPPPPDKNPAPPPPPKAVELTKDLFDKIAKGMSKDALTALLGPPTQVQANPQPGVEERLIWASPGTKIMVSMAGGKTLFKFTTQDWPVVYP